MHIIYKVLAYKEDILYTVLQDVYTIHKGVTQHNLRNI